MGRLLATLAALNGLVLPVLALSAPTAIMLVPGHQLFSVLVISGSLVHGWTGHPDLARRWLLAYLVATMATVGSLEVGAMVRGSELAYWAVPWVAVLFWGWIPPLVCGAAGAVGTLRERRLIRSVVRARRTGLRQAKPPEEPEQPEQPQPPEEQGRRAAEPST